MFSRVQRGEICGCIRGLSLGHSRHNWQLGAARLSLSRGEKCCSSPHRRICADWGIEGLLPSGAVRWGRLWRGKEEQKLVFLPHQKWNLLGVLCIVCLCNDNWLSSVSISLRFCFALIWVLSYFLSFSLNNPLYDFLRNPTSSSFPKERHFDPCNRERILSEADNIVFL